MKTRIIATAFLLVLACLSALAQQPTNPTPAVDINDLPEYVVIRADFGGRPVTFFIDSRNSPHKAALKALEDALTNKKKLWIQNRTDLLNALSNLGFDYVDNIPFGQSSSASIVFRKKPEYRQ
ncbi:MAG: hypothetical protein WA958_16500 [Tunicatimonas sp.]